MHVAFISSITRLPSRTESLACPRTKGRAASIYPNQTFACLSNQNPFQTNLHSLQTQISPILSVQSHDVLLTAALVAAAGLWLLLWQTMTSKNLVPSSVTRKVIHVSCGSLFVAIWPLYSDVFSARLLAAIVPMCFISLLTVSGYAREDQTTRAALGRAISREGKAADALQGPLYYSIVLMLVSLLLFKSPIAVIVIAQLCFGDGAAEIIGRRFGANSPWGFSWTGNKTIVGSSAFVLAALAASCAGLSWWHYWNLVDASVLSPVTFFSLAMISAACAATELAPKEIAVDDNLTVAATAAAMSVALFGWWPF